MSIIFCLFLFSSSFLNSQPHAQLVEKYDRKIIKCLKKSPFGHELRVERRIPIDIEQHYQQLLSQTEIYRSISSHSAAGYSGPWIENLFIKKFLSYPLSSFSGMIPLFIQWTDIHVHHFQHNLSYVSSIDSKLSLKDIFTNISKLLHDDIIYIAVSQDSQGINILNKLKPNILSISSGGYGHIAIPLIKNELLYVNPPLKYNFKTYLGFYGTLKYSHRRE